MSKPLLIFDMDGVLVDVTESYRETIARTVAHFTGAEITHERIQDYKNQGGCNDDWELTHRIILDAGVEAEFEEVKERFQRLFLGNGDDGLIQRERWIARAGLLENFAERFRFAIFTGRPREEAEITLNRFANGLCFDPILSMESVLNHKPHPEGLLRILDHELEISGPSFGACYIGDTVDDARCARAADVPFIGIAGPSNPRYLDLVFLFQEEGAKAIVDDINCLDEVFA